MKIKFWGVRGSIPSPGPKTVKYGGNTTCIEVRTDENEIIIFDSGTGIFPLSHTLLAHMPVTCHIFISHTHWDHIQGLPFFVPAFIPNNHIHIYGAFDPINQRNINAILSQQMEYCYYPVREAELKAALHYTTLRERQVIQVGENTTVTNILMNHPVLDFGYLVNNNGKRVFFTGDHEWPFNIYEPDDEDYHEFDALIQHRRQLILDFIQGVDVLIADSAYTEEEYHAAKKGWGHGTYDSSIQMARDAKAKHLFFTHHEPTRPDTVLEQLLADAKARYPHQPGDPQYHLAQEGLTFEIR
jgi:phosphoribosyl 1,2-cyclic phosphodiesterase